MAHGALAAGWVHQDAPKQRQPMTTCVQAPDEMPNFTPRREMLARVEIELVNEASQP